MDAVVELHIDHYAGSVAQATGRAPKARGSAAVHSVGIGACVLRKQWAWTATEDAINTGDLPVAPNEGTREVRKTDCPIRTTHESFWRPDRSASGSASFG
jgi:hypothetical protein